MASVIDQLGVARFTYMKKYGRLPPFFCLGESVVERMARECYDALPFIWEAGTEMRVRVLESEHVKNTLESAKKGELYVFGVKIKVVEGM